MIKIINKDKITDEVLEKHVKYVQGVFATNKKFQLVGSLMDGSGGGTYIYDLETEAEVQAIIDHDPFYLEGIADYEIIPYVIRHNRLKYV